MVFGPGARYVFKYVYAYEITNRRVMFVTGSAPVRNLCAFAEKYWPRVGREY